MIECIRNEFAEISQWFWWVQPIGWNEPTFEEHSVWLLWGQEKSFNDDNYSVSSVSYFAPAHQPGFLFSAHLFPSAQNVNLDLLFSRKNTPKSARSEPLRTPVNPAENDPCSGHKISVRYECPTKVLAFFCQIINFELNWAISFWRLAFS